MFQATFIQKVLLATVFAFVSGCADNKFRHADESTATPSESICDSLDSADNSPKYQMGNYLTARENLINNLVPEEQQAAVRILNMMLEFIAEGYCEPGEVSVRFSDMSASPEYNWPERTYVDLRVPEPKNTVPRSMIRGIIARPFTIQMNHVHAIDFEVEAYIYGCDCCYDSLFPKEYYQGFWEDVGKLSHVEELRLDDRILDQDAIAVMVRDSRKNPKP